MKKAVAMADNCIDVYHKLNRFYLTGNSIDFAFNYKDLGGNITVLTILGNDFFADALVEKLKEKQIPMRLLKKSDHPTGMAKMDMAGNDKIHLEFSGNAMESIELTSEDKKFIEQFDIVYAERWSKANTFIKDVRKDNQIWIYDFSKRLDKKINDQLLPYLDYAFFSYDKNDGWIRDFIKKAHAKGTKCVVAMLGPEGSLAYDGQEFYFEPAEKVEVVNTVGAGDSYIAAFTYGLSLDESIQQCMKRGKEQATKIIQQFEPYEI